VAAQNILATVRGDRLKPFVYSTIGLLAPIGKRTGVANILGVNFSGFIAWWLWRTIYLLKLPRFEKKVLVALDWTLDLLFSKDLVHKNGRNQHDSLTPRAIKHQPDFGRCSTSGMGLVSGGASHLLDTDRIS